MELLSDDGYQELKSELPTPPTPPAAFDFHLPDPITYIVQDDDTLTKLALKFNTSIGELCIMNHLSSQLIYPSQVLYIPSGDNNSFAGDNIPTASGNSSATTITALPTTDEEQLNNSATYAPSPRLYASADRSSLFPGFYKPLQLFRSSSDKASSSHRGLVSCQTDIKLDASLLRGQDLSLRTFVELALNPTSLGLHFQSHTLHNNPHIVVITEDDPTLTTGHDLCQQYSLPLESLLGVFFYKSHDALLHEDHTRYACSPVLPSADKNKEPCGDGESGAWIPSPLPLPTNTTTTTTTTTTTPLPLQKNSCASDGTSLFQTSFDSFVFIDANGGGDHSDLSQLSNNLESNHDPNHHHHSCDRTTGIAGRYTDPYADTDAILDDWCHSQTDDDNNNTMSTTTTNRFSVFGSCFEPLRLKAASMSPVAATKKKEPKYPRYRLRSTASQDEARNWLIQRKILSTTGHGIPSDRLSSTHDNTSHHPKNSDDAPPPPADLLLSPPPEHLSRRADVKLLPLLSPSFTTRFRASFIYVDMHIRQDLLTTSCHNLFGSISQMEDNCICKLRFEINSKHLESLHEILRDNLSTMSTSPTLPKTTNTITHPPPHALSLWDESLPQLNHKSNIFLPDFLAQLSCRFPSRAAVQPMSLGYSTAIHGTSMRTLYRNMLNYRDSPSLFVVKDEAEWVFGAILSCLPHISSEFYGNGECIMFGKPLNGPLRFFSWTQKNANFIKGDESFFAIGGGRNGYGLWINEDLVHGHSGTCETFDNEVISSSQDFKCQLIEVWVFQ